MLKSTNDIYSLREQAQAYGGLSSVYFEKMMHVVPRVSVVRRERFLLKAAKNKVILDIGCANPMGEALRRAARVHYGIDIKPDAFPDRYFELDLDKAESLPYICDLELIIAGEVLEHLSNAGHFLDLLRATKKPVIITVPNAFGSVQQYYIGRGIEHVNVDHTCWYSWQTFKTLSDRHGFKIVQWYWYNGNPGTAEGMIFCME